MLNISCQRFFNLRILSRGRNKNFNYTSISKKLNAYEHFYNNNYNNNGYIFVVIHFQSISIQFFLAGIFFFLCLNLIIFNYHSLLL